MIRVLFLSFLFLIQYLEVYLPTEYTESGRELVQIFGIRPDIYLGGYQI